MSGKTQGVITASNPVTKQSKKMLHIEPSVFSDAAPASATSLVLASSAALAPLIITFIFSSPLGNSSPLTPSQLKEPFTAVAPALIPSVYSKVTLS